MEQFTVAFKGKIHPLSVHKFPIKEKMQFQRDLTAIVATDLSRAICRDYRSTRLELSGSTPSIGRTKRGNSSPNCASILATFPMSHQRTT